MKTAIPLSAMPAIPATDESRQAAGMAGFLRLELDVLRSVELDISDAPGCHGNYGSTPALCEGCVWRASCEATIAAPPAKRRRRNG